MQPLHEFKTMMATPAWNVKEEKETGIDLKSVSESLPLTWSEKVLNLTKVLHNYISGK